MLDLCSTTKEKGREVFRECILEKEGTRPMPSTARAITEEEDSSRQEAREKKNGT